MNFDLITKLAKLANNNPNENEANLAARKVCKLLAEANFKFINSGPEPKQQQREQYNPFDGSNFYDWFTRYAARDRDEEQKRKQHKANYDWWQPSDRQKWYYEREPKEYKSPFESEKTKWPGDDPFKKPSEQAKEKRMLKCKTCKNSKLTSFVGAAECYECNNCQWTAYATKK